MSASVGLLGYFILEASELVERLDAIVAASGAAGPDAEALALTARKLRGSATMAKLAPMAELGAGIERVGRALRDGTLGWTPALRGVLVAAVDDVRSLLRNVRSWGLEDDARAATRVAELKRFTPSGKSGPLPLGAADPSARAAAARAPRPTPLGSLPVAAAYVAQGAADVAAALDGALAREGDRGAFAHAMDRVRALRGHAAVRDVAVVNDLVDALDQVGKSVEVAGGTLGPSERSLVSAAAAALRRAAADLTSGTPPEADSPEITRFAASLAALDDRQASAERVMPIASLFADDAGPHLIARAPNPPTTPAARFRMEVVSLAEHIRGGVASARAADGPAAATRAGRALRQALAALQESAASFGEESTVRFVRAISDAAGALVPAALEALDAGARLLTEQNASSSETGRRLDELAKKANTPPAPPSGRPRAETPTGRQLHDFLQTGISGIDRLNDEALPAGPASSPAPSPVPARPAPPVTAAPAAAAEESLVPIEQLFYRGQAALGRARELRATIRARGTAPSADDVAELFDLLDLAAE
jgi:chemotaxis protein histidine kinase CheA